MEDAEPIAVASAVVVPGQEEESTKRRPSHSSPETTKRPRLSTDNGSEATAADKRRRITGAEEEKRRGKRLFGALLGTIGKFQKETSSARARTNAVKRKEVEQKLQEKLKAQTEELDEQRKREDEDLSLRKRVESREFEKRAMHIRHNNLLAQANMLSTTTTPKLFYLPWKLLPSQEDIIREQIYAAEETVRNAEEAFQQVREQDEAQLQAMGGGGGGDVVPPPPPEVSNTDHDVDPLADQPDISIHTPPHDGIAEVIEGGEVAAEEKRAHSDEHGDNADNNPVPRDNDNNNEETIARRNSDIGDAADIIVDEGGEDTVIY